MNNNIFCDTNLAIIDLKSEFLQTKLEITSYENHESMLK